MTSVAPARTRVTQRICEAIRGQIASGLLGPDARLPSTRSLAAEWGVSRTTVTAAYEQLIAEGYLETRPGAGARVARGLIPNPADQCAGGLGGVAAGHQPKWVAALMISGMSARVRQRSPSAASRSLSVAKCLFATASSASGQRCSAGCSSGV